MQDIGFKFSEANFCLAYPGELTEVIELMFRDVQLTEQTQNERAVEIIREDRNQTYRIISESRESKPLAGYPCLIEELPSFILNEIVNTLDPGLFIHAAALAAADKIILFPGQRSVGKSMLASFLVAKGWHYLTDRGAHFDENNIAWHYLGLPPAVNSDDWLRVSALLGGKIEKYLMGNRKYHLILDPTVSTTTAAPPALLVFPRYLNGDKLKLTPLSPERAAVELLNCASHRSEPMSDRAATVADKIPALQLTYGDCSQLEHLGPALSYIAEHTPSTVELTELLASFELRCADTALRPEAELSQSAQPAYAVPEATPSGKKKVMTIGMATFDDYDGVYFTVQAIRMYHPEVTELTEILVIDNNPGGPASQALKNLEDIVANYRYLPFGSRNSTAVRDLVFRQANADFVLCLDGHVMLQPGTLRQLVDYFENHLGCQDLLQGPMLSENLGSLHTHFEPIWSKGMYGRWGSDKRAENPDGPAFEIPMQGLGLFACRKDAWVGFNPRFRGFGGEEGYLHEKFRQRGGKALCLPFLRWLHRFSRPDGVPYPINWHDRIFNYLIGHHELGLDPEPVRVHFTEPLGEEPASEILNQIEDEIRSPFFFFDAIYCITLDADSSNVEEMYRGLNALGIEASVRIHKAVVTADYYHSGRTLSHRSIISEAMLQELDNVLVFDEETIFLEEPPALLLRSIEELKRREWNLLYLGGDRGEQNNPPAAGCRYLSVAQRSTPTHTVAYSKQVFEKILHDLPDSQKAMPAWLHDHHGLDHYLSSIDKRFMAEPQIATTVPPGQQLAMEDQHLKSPRSLRNMTDR